MNETELWNLKDHGFGNYLLWKIHKKVLPHQRGSKHCNLCLLEKVSVICVDPDSLLKKRTNLQVSQQN